MTKEEAGAKIAGQDDELCPQEIADCFDSLCDSYICDAATAGETCNCDHYNISLPFEVPMSFHLTNVVHMSYNFRSMFVQISHTQCFGIAMAVAWL